MEQIRVATFAGPGAQPVIRTVPWPNIPKKAALIKIGACGVCGTDLHILKGHWPKKLPYLLKSTSVNTMFHFRFRFLNSNKSLWLLTLSPNSRWYRFSHWTAPP